MDSILVTGGTGFIGQPLVRQLLAMDYAVIVLTRNLAQQDSLNDHALRYINSFESISNTTRIRAIINLAGEPLSAGRWNAKRKKAFVDSRVQTTVELQELVQRLQHTPEVLINGSAVGWYGPHGSETLDECGSPVQCFSHMLCESWEECAREFSMLGMRVCLLRIGIVLGPNGGPLEDMVRTLKYGVAATLGSGDQWLSWIHIQDMVEMITFLLEQYQLSGVVNGTAPNPVTNAEFTALAAARRKTWLKVRVPSNVLRLVVGEMAQEIVLTGQRVMPAKVQGAGFEFHYPDLEAALRDLM